MVRRWYRVLLLGAFALGACTAPASPPPAAPTAIARAPAPSSPTPAPTPFPVRQLELPVATVSATTTPLWVGVDYGFFQRYGLAVQVTGLAPAAATQAVQTGTVPFAATAGSTISAFVSGARDLRYIAGLVNRVPFQLIGQPDLERVEDLRGRAAATSTPGSSSAVGLMEILRRHGLEPDRDVAVLYLRDQPSILTGLVSGQAAAGILASPYTTQARNQGFRLLVDTIEAGIELLGLNITSTRDVVEREPDLARRFLMAYVESVQFARHEAAPTIESIMRGTRNEDRALAEEAYALYRTIWDVRLSLPAIAGILGALDLPGARDVRPEEIVDDRLLRELEASGWLAQHLTPP